MKISFNDLLKTLVKNENKVIDLILEYGKIKQQMAKSENRSWYFRQAEDSRMKKLAELNSRFESIRNHFNNTPIDILIAELNEIKEKQANHITLNNRTMDTFVRTSLALKVSWLLQLIELKARTESLHPIEHYFVNTCDLLAISGW